MNLRSISLVSLLFVLSLVLVGCPSNKKDNQQPMVNKQEVVISLGDDEPEGGLDPCIGWGRYGSPLIQSTLVETDANMNIVNDLATEYKISDNGLILTFKLRKDVKFSDGVALTANDVVFTFNTAKNSGSIVDLTDMLSVKALDNYTVEFELFKPVFPFIYTIAATGIVPEHAYVKGYADKPIGSGPFKLLQWDKGQQIIFIANESYYGTVPAIKKVTMLFLSEDASFAFAKAGKLDIAYTAANLALNKVDGMSLAKIKSIDNRGLTLPTIKDEGKKNKQGYFIGNNVTSDIAIRRALSYGIDRDMLVNDVINGFGRPAYSECDDMPWWNEATVVEYNVEKAKTMLDNAGWKVAKDGVRYKGNVKAEFNLIYSAGETTRQAIATSVKEQAKRLGIVINLAGLSWDEIYKRMYQDAVLMGWGDQNPLETYLLYHKDNMGKDAHNPENFNNSKVDGYIAKAMSAKDLNSSIEYWKKAQWDGETGTSTLGDAPFVWLTNIDHLYYIKTGLDIGTQKIHPHGHAWPLVQNLRDWVWK